MRNARECRDAARRGVRRYSLDLGSSGYVLEVFECPLRSVEVFGSLPESMEFFGFGIQRMEGDAVLDVHTSIALAQFYVKYRTQIYQNVLVSCGNKGMALFSHKTNIF